MSRQIQFGRKRRKKGRRKKKRKKLCPGAAHEPNSCTIGKKLSLVAIFPDVWQEDTRGPVGRHEASSARVPLCHAAPFPGRGKPVGARPTTVGKKAHPTPTT